MQALRLRPYDVVLLDEHMPALDAPETAKRIRSLPALWKQPWIILLCDHQEGGVPHTIQAIDDVIAKPINEAKLRQALARVQHVGRVLGA